MSSKNGYIASVAIHVVLLGAAVTFAAVRPDVKESEQQDGTLVELWTDDGSERAAGIPGKDRGAAEGHVSGNKQKTGFRHIPTINSKAILKEIKAADVRAAAAERKAAEAREAKEQKAAPEKTAKSDAKRESLSDFRQSTAKASRPGKGTASTSTGSTEPGGTGRVGISGALLGSTHGKNTGETGRGHADGKGAGGGDGGRGNAIKNFYGDVKNKFGDTYRPIWEDKGGGLDLSRYRDEVIVRVSSSGVVTFAGWAKPVSDPLVEKIVKLAISRMPRVTPPPPGADRELILDVTGKVADE